MESLKNCKGVMFILATERGRLPDRAHSSCTGNKGAKQRQLPGIQAVRSPVHTCDSQHR